MIDRALAFLLTWPVSMWTLLVLFLVILAVGFRRRPDDDEGAGWPRHW